MHCHLLRRSAPLACVIATALTAAACSTAAAKTPCERDATQAAWVITDSTFRADMQAAFSTARSTLSAADYGATVREWRARQDSMRQAWSQLQDVADTADALTGCTSAP